MVGVLALAACGDETPTQRSTSADPSLIAPSLAAASNTWTEKAPFLADQYLGGWSVGMAPNTKGESIVHAIGGSSGDDGSTAYRIEAYNTVTNIWTNKSSRAGAFGLNGVGKFGGRLYLSGGSDYGSGSLAYHNSLWAYDYSNGLIRKAGIPVCSGGVIGVIKGRAFPQAWSRGSHQ